MNAIVVQISSLGIIILFSVYVLMTIMVDSPLLLMDLSLFIIAEYIKILCFKFKLLEDESNSDIDHKKRVLR